MKKLCHYISEYMGALVLGAAVLALLLEILLRITIFRKLPG